MPNAWSTLSTECKRLLSPFLSTEDQGLKYRRFGIEFAPEVVQADGNVRNIAWRICNAKKVLVSST